MGVDDEQKPGEFASAALTMENLSYNLASVTLTLPTFWTQNPDAWFTKIEAQFKNSRISSEETQYYKVLAVLPESAAIRVREITQKTQYSTGDYKLLKEKLIESGQPTTLERLDKLCELEGVAHKKPSETLLELENIFHSSSAERAFPTNNHFKTFWWLRALPVQIQQNLLPIADITPLDKLVAVADQMFATNPPVERVSELTFQNSSDELSSSAASDGDPSPEFFSAALQRRYRKPLQSPKKDQLLLCKYHIKFGDRAKKCVQGCARFETNQKN